MRCSVLLMIWSIQQECTFHSTLQIASWQWLSLFLLPVLWIKKFIHLHFAHEFKTSLPILLVPVNLFSLVLCPLSLLAMPLRFSCRLNEKVSACDLSVYLRKAALILTLAYLMENVNNHVIIEGYTWAKRRKIILKIIHHLGL